MTRVPSYSASECGCLVLWLRMAGHFTTVGFRVAAVFCVSAFLYPSVATGQRASRTALWHLARETGGATAPGRCKHVRTSQSGRGERFCRAWPAQRLQLLPDPQRRSCARATRPDPCALRCASLLSRCQKLCGNDSSAVGASQGSCAQDPGVEPKLRCTPRSQAQPWCSSIKLPRLSLVSRLFVKMSSPLTRGGIPC